MKYCFRCGREIAEEAIFCPFCGVAQGQVNNTQPMQNPLDSRSFGWALLGFLFPVIGLILYLVWKDEYPLRSKSIGKGAIISVITVAALYALYILALVILVVATLLLL